MKPLLKTELDSFNDRFCNFVDAELRNVDITSPTTMLVKVATQDKNKEFDWITLELEFGGVSDANLIDDSKLSFVDMSEGANIINEDNHFGFCLGSYKNISSLKNSLLYIISSNLKYEIKPYN